MQPVYLRADLRGNAGTILCCDHTPFACLPDKCQCCRLFASIKINIVDMSDYAAHSPSTYSNVPVDSKLLHEPITKDMLSHEPYTPESVDSHTHSPLSEKEDVDSDVRRGSVSPLQLKNRLECIIERDLRKSPKLMIRSASENVQIGHPRDNFFRNRAMSEIPKSARARLIPSDSVYSLQRLQSHHSSSDEEWFEFENATPTNSLENCGGNVVGSLGGDVSKEMKQIAVMEEDRMPRKHCRLKFKTRQKICCCVIV